jgi:elongation factor Tu
VKTIIVFLNKIDVMSDPEMHEIVEMEVRELLDKNEYDGNASIIIKGSALMALNGENSEIGENKVIELLKTMDDIIPIPERPIDKPFVMSIEGTYNIEGRGTVVVGTIEQGKVKPGDEVEIIGYNNESKKTTVTGVETFKKTLDYGEAGDNVGLLIRGLTRKNVFRGQTICKPNALSVHQCFEAQIYIMKEEEGGRKKGFYTGFRPQVFLRTADVAADIILPPQLKIAMPGDNLTVKFRLNNPLALHSGIRFALRECGKTIGHGIITKVLKDTDIPANAGRMARQEMEALAEKTEQATPPPQK